MVKAPVLTPRAEDFPRWYQDVLNKAELAENGPVRGTMVVRPYGYSIWERMQADVDDRIKAAGAQNAYFPLFIPESYLRREAEHVEGFSPELAVVTHAGGKELDEPVVVRPTSETVIGESMSRWIQSYRDLPLLLNQWANVVRWELRPRIFLRTSEFLWQEGHTAHATEADAAGYARQILHQVYERFMVDVMALSVVVGAKSPSERFAGATNTMTLEAMTGDHKALQMGTSHELGQNFARAFDITYLDDTGTLQHVWTASWGVSTRMVGGLIMAHGDDAGLRLPPRLAPVQVVVLAVRDDPEVLDRARAMTEELSAAGLRVHLDDQTGVSLGRRVTDWELKGVPVRLELGPRDLAQAQVTLVRRVGGSKTAVPIDGVTRAVQAAQDEIQLEMLDQSRRQREGATRDVQSVEEAVEASAEGWARLDWSAVGAEGEKSLAQHGVTVRCLVRPDGSLPETTNEPDLVAYTARSY